MNRLITLILMVMMIVMAAGCQNSAPVIPPDSSSPGQNQEILGTIEPPGNSEPADSVFSTESLGGIRLGMTGEQVEKLRGKNYTDELHAEGGYFGESLIIRQYSDGCSMVIGKETNKVLQVDVSSEDYPTDLGFKVGDPSIKVMETYRAQFEEFVGNQSSDKLMGWFLIDETGELLIFSSMESQERFNENITADSKITGITLGRAQYFD